ncbi:MAG TPA: metallophosphoesterase family protein [Solirubrobacteraceae bacterium]|nr:metallophosphoesterase family protein [Solirubrobacteraceae bacterium]
MGLSLRNPPDTRFDRGGGRGSSLPPRRSRRRIALALAALALAAVVVALTGLWLGIRLAGTDTRETPLGRASVQVSVASHGGVEAFIPVADWGLRFHAFRGPVVLHVEPRAVDRQAVIRAVSGDQHVLAGTEAQLRKAAAHVSISAWLWGAGIALALGALVALGLAHATRRRAIVLGFPVAVCSIALLVGLGVLLRVRSTFDSHAFEHPVFYARGAELAQLLHASSKVTATQNGYTSTLAQTLQGFATLLEDSTLQRVPPGNRDALLVSDLHGNVLALGPLRRYASGQPIYFVGDFGQTGSAAEAKALVPRVSRLGARVVAVSGNHDSGLLMRRLARAGVTVLTASGRLRANGSVSGPPVVRVDGLRVAGYGDPFEYHGPDPADPSRIYSFADLPGGGKPEFNDAEQRLIAWARGLRPRPDVLMVHENGLAQGLAQALHARGWTHALTILTGHDHVQHVDRYGAITVADAGSVGAGGVFGAGHTYIGLGQLHFGTRPPALRAVDLVKSDPFTGAAQADRIVIDSQGVCGPGAIPTCSPRSATGPAARLLRVHP